MKICNSRELLRQKGLKITPVRLQMLDLFLLEKKPLDAEMISKKVKGKKDIVTIYRNLSVFEQKGIIKKLHLGRDSVFYEFPHSHHHHIVCKHCGDIEDFDFCVIKEISKKALCMSKRFSKINDHSLELFGVCKKCV